MIAPTQSTPAGSRTRWELVQALKKAASGTSTEFYRWWWKLSKDERRVLLDDAAETVDTVPLEDSGALRASAL